LHVSNLCFRGSEETVTDAVVTARKASIGAIVLMLMFVARMLFLGYFVVSEWQSESALLAACGVVWIIAAPATILSTLWLLGSRGHSRAALTVGGWANMASGAVFVTSVATRILPRSVLTARASHFRWKSSGGRNHCTDPEQADATLCAQPVIIISSGGLVVLPTGQ
jgi:hypothetical protein